MIFSTIIIIFIFNIQISQFSDSLKRSQIQRSYEIIARDYKTKKTRPKKREVGNLQKLVEAEKRDKLN